MNQELFVEVVNTKARKIGISPLLLLSGLEGLYTFKDVQINHINYRFLDNLILTIFALRIGDSFHTIAEENLSNPSQKVRAAATKELTELSPNDIVQSNDPYLQSFATIVDGKSTIRKYHQKALEVAALEVRKTQLSFGEESIGAIMLHICKTELSESIDLGSLFTT
jgi:hypothetical protein